MVVVKMVEGWLSISEIAKRLDIAENTARRYANFFSIFLKERKFGRTTKYTPEAIEVIAKIANFYSQGLTTEEIKGKLQDELPQIVDMEEEENQMILSSGVSSYEILKQIQDEQQKQQEFNKRLLEKLDEQQRYIEQRLEKRDEMLVETLRQLAASREDRKRSTSWWGRILGKNKS